MMIYNMKTFKGLSAVALLGAMITGCNHLEIQPEEENLQTLEIKEITAYNGDASTKTVLADDRTSILWNPSDQIKVFYGSASAQFTAMNTEPEECTIFSSNTALVYGGTESSSSYIWAVYPYTNNSTHDKTSVSLTVPNSTTAVAGSFANGSFPAIGRSKDTNIAFYNVCGGICFTVTNENVQSVTITGNNNEDIAGTVKVGFDENDRPIVTEVTAGQKKTTIYGGPYSNNCFQVGTWYYIPMLPVNFTNGFIMQFFKPYKSSGTESAILVVNSPYEVRRSIFGQVENADNNLTYRVNVSTVSFSYPKAYIASGSTLQLPYSISPSSAVYDSMVWTSSDENIATVDQNGVVTPISSGTCSITLTVDHVSTSCTVYVSSPSVTTQEATNVSYGSAVLNGSLSAPGIDDYPRTKVFKYSKTANTLEGLISNGTTVTSSSVEGDNFHTSISGLEPNTTYYYVADCYFYTYRNGSSDGGTANHYYGSVQSFTTTAIPTLPDGLVDLGLSVKWASCNAGADKPEEVGNLYAWGEASPKDSYSWSNYAWFRYDNDNHNINDDDEEWYKMTKYGSSYSNANYIMCNWSFSYCWVNDGKTVLDLDDDAARAEWRGTWRMPTQAECQELIDNCTIEKVKYNNSDGLLFTCTKAGYTDKQLFFPLSPVMSAGDQNFDNNGTYSYRGLFWSSSQYLPFPFCAYALRSRYPYTDYSFGPTTRFTGFPVRPVK